MPIAGCTPGYPLGFLDHGMNSIDLLEDQHSKVQSLCQLEADLRRNLGGWAGVTLALCSLVLVIIELSTQPEF